jgi:hypothetical protein
LKHKEGGPKRAALLVKCGTGKSNVSAFNVLISHDIGRDVWGGINGTDRRISNPELSLVT